MIANNQFATIDISNGEQVEFDASISKCPTILEGAIIKEISGGRMVVKL